MPETNKQNNKLKKLTETELTLPDYESVLSGMVDLLEQARRMSARTVNAVMTATYWEMGRRIVELEQGGKKRADYGEKILENLSQDLTKRFGRGFSRQNIQQMRAFYLTYEQIRQTLSSEFNLTELAKIFPLTWSHYALLLACKNKDEREFYETESTRGSWTVRQLKRQMNSSFFTRTLLSKNKASMLKKGQTATIEDAVTPEEEIKDPLVLEFLNLKDEYSENELEEALIRHLETFLLELGDDFAFIGRQRKLRIGNQWFRVDLLFFHRRLKCLIIIDLKTGEFTYADAGQMHLYLNYAKENWMKEGENPPVGLILCTSKDEDVVRYTLDNLPNKILAAEYRTVLPDEKLLVEEIIKTRKMYELYLKDRQKNKVK
jgi:predicted nuclease of restriction endonuclease-like (RecB) superfamily